MFLRACVVALLACASVTAQTINSTGDGTRPGNAAAESDPFIGVTAVERPAEAVSPQRSWRESLMNENFGFRKELMSEFATDAEGRGYSRQSVGFEVLKKFSNATATIASFDFQGRLVRRDGRFLPVMNDMEGATRPGWAFEYHNLYVDLYNVLNPMLSVEQRGRTVGRVNFRAGRFYVPFGLNLQTDTHGTLLQLSNEDNFGFERDWYAGFWGRVNQHLNYDAYYLTGSGYDLSYKGQSGMGAIRLSLANRYSSLYGLEGGVSFLSGERLAGMGLTASSLLAEPARGNESTMPLRTQRTGVDARYRKPVPHGVLSLTTEVSRGRDAFTRVITQLYQADYLAASRRWGIATQYRQFALAAQVRRSLIAEASWYFRNDVTNSNSSWVKLAVERRLGDVQPPHTIVAVQYYLYR